MKKRNENKKPVFYNHSKQLSLLSFFPSKNNEMKDKDRHIPPAVKETKRSEIKDENINQLSPDIIDTSSESKLVSKLIFSNNKLSNTADTRLISKKRLFHETLNLLPDDGEMTETKNASTRSPNKVSTLTENNIMNELLEKFKNSPLKSKQESVINSNCLNFVVSPIKNNKKRIKLSLSSSKKNNRVFLDSKYELVNGNTLSSENNLLREQSFYSNRIVQQSSDNNLTYKTSVIHTPRNKLEYTKISNKVIEKENQTDKKSTDVKETKDGLTDIEDIAYMFDEDWDFLALKELNLAKWNYCEIIMIEASGNGFIVKLKGTSKSNNSLSTSCIIRGYWGDCSLKVGDVISIKARYDTALNSWLVDEKDGFIVKHPDILVTGTGIVGSLFCLRQSVLSYLFPGFDPPNVSMLIGSLVHELFQEVLKKKCYSEIAMKNIAADLVKNQRTLYLAYEYNVSLSTLQMELDKFLPRILSFVDTYITKNIKKGKTWSGIIQEILSIEENFWVPNLGIKGKTDLIVKANKNGNIKTMPIELKTGRASNSAEHRGQIILYLMMISELGMNVDSGLLLYLRENILHEIKPQHSEFNGLITMRNNLVDFYKKNENMLSSSKNKFDVPVLPKPINHHSGCAKCPYLTICSAVLSEEPGEKISESNPLNVLSVKSIEHLSTSHIQYVFQWLGLLKLEELERKKKQFFTISDIWHLDHEEREKRGNCINKLFLVNVEVIRNKFLHYFRRKDNDYNFTSSRLADGDYVIISEGSRYAVATGYVYNISDSSVCLKIDRPLSEKQNLVYAVDKYSVSEGLLGFNTSSLLLLLENSDSAARLRSFIIDLELPLFSSISNISLENGESILSKLNIFQKKAVLKAIAAKDYVLIKGMAGTGKTATIVALVKLLLHLNCTILVISHTHSAVDNILLKLKDNADFLRLGSSSKVHQALKSYCEDAIFKKHSFHTTEDLENFYNKKRIVGVTCMGCSHVLLKKRNFDYCIVDEATQVLQPSTIKGLYSSRKFVLLGDPEQLPPVVQSKQASHLGLSESLFKKLDRPEVTCTLCIQYRMNSEIMRVANSFAYNNLLQCDKEEINFATINCSYSSTIYNDHNWLKAVLSSHLSHSVLFLNTADLKVMNSISEYSNELEAHMAFIIVDAFTETCQQNYDIGIITPYQEQVELLRKTAIGKNYCNIEINTVDQYQGRDKDIIIYSCTKFCNPKEGGILADKRRLTVAITRAKRKLIIIGNIPVLQTYSTFNQLLQIILPENVINVVNVKKRI